MLDVDRLIIVCASLQRDDERIRWYCDGGEACLVLTSRGRLLEPHPTFGPVAYRLLACRASFAEADAYALAHGFHHIRALHGRPLAR